MRDNLMFFGIDESVSPEMRVPGVDEKCDEKVTEFCEKVLLIEDPATKIQIDRAHRVGRFVSGKTRPTVVKFKDTSSKMTVKKSLRQVNLFHTPYNVTEQFPKEIRERRKQLVPVMMQARKDGNKAVLVRDKLYINNVLYTGGSR